MSKVPSTKPDLSTKIDLPKNFPRRFASKWKAKCRAKLPGCQHEKIKIDDADNYSSTSWVTIIETDEDVCRKRRIHVSSYIKCPVFKAALKLNII